MKANRDYRLLHRRGGRLPSRFAAPERYDQVEIVEVATMETVLLWDVPAREVGPLLRELRADLAQLEGADFFAKWRER